jgi:hypothetical protein
MATRGMLLLALLLLISSSVANLVWWALAWQGGALASVSHAPVGIVLFIIWVVQVATFAIAMESWIHLRTQQNPGRVGLFTVAMLGLFISAALCFFTPAIGAPLGLLMSVSALVISRIHVRESTA